MAAARRGRSAARPGRTPARLRQRTQRATGRHGVGVSRASVHCDHDASRATADWGAHGPLPTLDGMPDVRPPTGLVVGLRPRHDAHRHRARLREHADGPRGELGVDLPVEEIAARLGPPLDGSCAASPGRRGDRAGRRPVPGALRRPRHPRRRGARRRRRRDRRRTPPRRPGRGGHRQVRAATPAATSTTSPSTSTTSRACVWGVGKADVLLREGASILVGDHVHDVEGARAAGALSVSVLTGGCTEEELLDGRHRRRARRPHGVPGLARRAPRRAWPGLSG